ncbi:hypothetical protein IMX26_14745 [Clostridium sp. 'deep sea']|nr:hypothetical protein [Clostridium sp. 'deep sea']QOR34714.1 hypothetical protein IMX26_14745 [Clostridium sp. 'deep sea']
MSIKQILIIEIRLISIVAKLKTIILGVKLKRSKIQIKILAIKNNFREIP